MQNLEHLFFSPLGKEFCLYFYYLTVISFIFLAIAVIGGAYSILRGKANVLATVVAMIAPFLVYLNNRLLYSMCAR